MYKLNDAAVEKLAGLDRHKAFVLVPVPNVMFDLRDVLPDDSERMKVYARVIRQRDGTKLVNIENASHSLLFSHTFD